MSKRNKPDEMLAEEMQALAIPVLASYSEDEVFDLEPTEQADLYPLIALRNMSIFPGTLVPILIGRKKSMKVVRLAVVDSALPSSASPRVVPIWRARSSFSMIAFLRRSVRRKSGCSRSSSMTEWFTSSST